MNDKFPLLALDKIRAFNHSRHHIIADYKARSIEEASDSLLGLHSARLPSAFISLQSRLHNIKPSDLSSELYYTRKLIKLRCMRKTLHSVSFKMAPIVHKATLNLRTSDCRRYFKNNTINQYDIDLIENEIMTILDNGEQDVEYILTLIQHRLKKKYHKELSKIVLKFCWEQGKLCYVNKSSHWGKEKRYFAITKKFYPLLNLDEFSEETAQKILVTEHIKRYGPVSIGDISWWSGLSKSIVRRSIESAKESIIKVQIKGFDIDCFMTTEMFEEYNLFKPKGLEWLELLAYEDSSMKGYFETRFRYVDTENYGLLFNQIGEVRASIIANGIAIGIWQWDIKTKKINYRLFNAATKNNYKSIVESKVNAMETYLFSNNQLSIF